MNKKREPLIRAPIDKRAKNCKARQTVEEKMV